MIINQNNKNINYINNVLNKNSEGIIQPINIFKINKNSNIENNHNLISNNNIFYTTNFKNK